MLARLARLALSPEQLERFGLQLARILDYVALLQQVDVDDVPEYLPPEQPGSALRRDDIGPILTSEMALAAAPQKRGRLVVVPKFKED